MICAACGVASVDGAAFCRSCGQPIAGYSVAPSAAGSPVGAVISGPPLAVAPAQFYAGFWLRFVAYVIDSLLAGLVMGVFVAIAIGFLGVGFLRTIFAGMQPGNGGAPVNPAIPVMFIATMLLFGVVFMFVFWLYFAGMESSTHQATLGKIALGLKVTDMDGLPVSFGRASGRFFAKIITGLVPFAIGYIMAGFTAKKQALHDIIASCLVVRKA